MSQTPKRPGPTLPKPPTNHSPTSTLADTALLTGTHTITVASNAIIHPRAKLLSTHGIVNIGEGCIICERSSVGLTTAERMMGGENDVQEGVVLGRGVVVEQGAVVEAGSVGEGCVVEVGARVGRGCVLGK
ncbi:MAG: hypothetical protein M1830_010384, partial [Pleopsidium flavum]